MKPPKKKAGAFAGIHPAPPTPEQIAAMRVPDPATDAGGGPADARPPTDGAQPPAPKTADDDGKGGGAKP